MKVDLTNQVDCGDVNLSSIEYSDSYLEAIEYSKDARLFSCDELKALRESIKKLHAPDNFERYNSKEDKIKQMIRNYRVAVAK